LNTSLSKISAILLAAGESRRMGQPKLTLPWGHTTVLGQVVETFAAAGLEDILVVTGGARQQVEELVILLSKKYPVRGIHNPDYAETGMTSSIQAGLAALGAEVQAALVGLGDQPQVREQTIRRIGTAFIQPGPALVFPSYQGRRGHPWLVARRLWSDMQALPKNTTPRQFFKTYTGQIAYVTADESILQDLDTPGEYFRQRPLAP
jgi:molybdenum cofactor cytidylyltransferase